MNIRARPGSHHQVVQGNVHTAAIRKRSHQSRFLHPANIWGNMHGILYEACYCPHVVKEPSLGFPIAISDCMLSMWPYSFLSLLNCSVKLASNLGSRLCKVKPNSSKLEYMQAGNPFARALLMVRSLSYTGPANQVEQRLHAWNPKV